MWYFRNMCNFEKQKRFFFLSKVVLLHQTIIKEWLMFRWKMLAHIYLDPLFVKLKEKSLTPTFILTLTFIRQLRVCKMIIALGAFFHFLKNFIFWAKNRVKEQKWSKIGKKLVRTLSEEQHVVWLWFLVFLVRLRHFFHFSKILILDFDCDFDWNFDCDFWDAGVKWWYIKVFFFFFKKIFKFWSEKCGKGKEGPT